MVMGVSSAVCAQEAENLCTDGILLFREDFGGKEVSDPVIRTSPVERMSSGYQQIFKLEPDGSGADMKDGCFLVAKRGYHNSTMAFYSKWHIMDDHTYPNDYSRGYMLEINGKLIGDDVFYSTTIDVQESEQLSFLAYVANITTAGEFASWSTRDYYVYPKLTFVISDPQTGEELAHYDTDTIGHDWNNYPKSWELSAEWQLVGMNFTVPAGVTKAQFSIRNNTIASLYSDRGNDFALDDIEIHLCRMAEVYTTDTTVCDTVSRILWRGRSYEPAEVLRDTFPSADGYDSIYYILNVQTESCGQIDPPTPPEPTLYPLIVNKYNWVLLLDNTTFAQLFPGRSIRSLQWYRNGEPIPGAKEDDYSEHNELNGRFQLKLELDDNRTIWSLILEINTEQAVQPIQVSIYDSRGVPVQEHQVTHGIYLYRYEQGDQVWTEKKFIP